jgi:hypothetical protein
MKNLKRNFVPGCRGIWEEGTVAVRAASSVALVTRGMTKGSESPVS